MHSVKQETNNAIADPGGRAVQGLGFGPLACWDCGFESHRGHGCVSLMNVVCCQSQVPAMGRFLVQRSPAECGVSVGFRNLNSEVAKARVGLLRHPGGGGIKSNYFFIQD